AMARTDFWTDSQKAQTISAKEAKLKNRIDPWLSVQKEVKDALELAALNDDALTDELVGQLQELEQRFESLKADLRLSGPYDDYDVILAIYAGAGGTDAQDWAGMLLRMYVRWAEKNKLKLTMLDESLGDEAGLKSVTLTLSGNFVYGKLKGEHGVHRLVRLSPFNSSNLRQTSFAKVDVLPKIESPEALEIDSKDLRIDVYRSGGHGGQSVNTTDSAVRVTHIPTGISVAIQNERSQLQNRETALTILRSRLIQLQLEQHQEKLEQLKGPNQSAEWGNQIRSYVLHPYKQVKDLRTRYETSDIEGVLDGALDAFIDAYLDYSLASK
ncbi:MAG TPA: peptide chain release factor 2, partial [Candidatus Saccharimonadales bacterium]